MSNPIIKHMITRNCDNNCKYCIVRNIPDIEEARLSHIEDMYEVLSRNYQSIMITGGEPTLHPSFNLISFMAKANFQQVFLTTYKAAIFSSPKLIDKAFDAVTFSLHKLDKIPEVTNKIPVYASILDNLFYPGLIETLRVRGFSGLTINENHFGGSSFDSSRLDYTSGFSVKINRRGHCTNDSLMLPSGEIVDSFQVYMDKEKV